MDDLPKWGLRDILPRLIEDLESDIGYAKKIMAELNKNKMTPVWKLDILDELDYLVRDLKPEFPMQDGGYDTHSTRLKVILDVIESKNEQ